MVTKAKPGRLVIWWRQANSPVFRRPRLCAATEEGTPKIVGFQLDEVLALSSMRIKLTTEPGDKDFRQPQKLIRALRVTRD